MRWFSHLRHLVSKLFPMPPAWRLLGFHSTSALSKLNVLQYLFIVISSIFIRSHKMSSDLNNFNHTNKLFWRTSCLIFDCETVSHHQLDIDARTLNYNWWWERRMCWNDKLPQINLYTVSAWSSFGAKVQSALNVTTLFIWHHLTSGNIGARVHTYIRYM